MASLEPFDDPHGSSRREGTEKHGCLQLGGGSLRGGRQQWVSVNFPARGKFWVSENLPQTAVGHDGCLRLLPATEGLPSPPSPKTAVFSYPPGSGCTPGGVPAFARAGAPGNFAEKLRRHPSKREGSRRISGYGTLHPLRNPRSCSGPPKARREGTYGLIGTFR